MIPTVGRIVHFLEGQAAPQAAIITQVWHADMVNLNIFRPNGGTSFMSSVARKGSASDGGHRSWDWPPQVETPKGKGSK